MNSDEQIVARARRRLQENRERYPRSVIETGVAKIMERCLADVGAGPRFARASLDELNGSLASRLRSYVDGLPSLADELERQRDSDPGFYLRNPDSEWSGGRWPDRESRQLLRGSRGLALFGSVGVGKTHSAVAVLRAGVERGHPARFISAAQLAADLRSSVANRGESPDEVIANLAEIPLLCIDDMDKLSGTAFICEQVFALVDARYRAELPIIITANTGPAGIAAAFEKLPSSGEAIVDRLREIIPNANWLELRGASRRAVA